MNLHEYQAKKILKNYGLIVPKGYICTNYNEAKNIIDKFDNNGPWVAKCQIHAGGRSAGGGIKIINDMNEMNLFFKKWIGNRLITYQTDEFGQIVNHILIESVITFVKELYVSVLIDRSTSSIIFMASTRGGVNIEKVAKEMPEFIYKVKIDILTGPMLYQARDLAFKLCLENGLIGSFSDLFIALVELFIKYDLSLIEINPLVITKEGDLVCLDVKIDVDNNSLYRQDELRKMRDPLQDDILEIRALENNLSYVRLNGSIGCMVNGAGLAMATMDVIKLYGGSAANFLDIGGSIDKNGVKKAFDIILSDKNVKVLLINIFGGIVRCDLIADGIIEVIQDISSFLNSLPVIVRFEGNNANLGINRLKKINNNKFKIFTTNDLIFAVKTAITMSM